jgi:hypothetical protein
MKEQVTPDCADDGHGKAPGEHLVEQGLAIIDERSRGNAQSADRRKGRGIDEVTGDDDRAGYCERITAAELRD